MFLRNLFVLVGCLLIAGAALYEFALLASAADEAETMACTTRPVAADTTAMTCSANSFASWGDPAVALGVVGLGFEAAALAVSLRPVQAAATPANDHVGAWLPPAGPASPLPPHLQHGHMASGVDRSRAVHDQ